MIKVDHFIMSRWSEEEDATILESIQELCDDTNYMEVVSLHNEKYKTNRTEEAYKARMKKIAKEHDIELNMSSRWKEDEIAYVINQIQINPFNIEWNEITSHLNRTKDSIYRKYNETVTAEEHLDCCLLNIDSDDIVTLMKELQHTCTHCSVVFYSQPCIWKEKEYCEECHSKLFELNMIELWEFIRDYSMKQQKDCCNLCKKKMIIDKDNIRRCHYDHVNMFNKSNSICTMIHTGIDIETILDEIDMCQLLCISCHNIVTKIEHMCGFIRVKRAIQKEYNETSDDNKRNELMKKYSDTYENFMSSIYSLIKTIV
jgi:hypothetical protein